MNPTKFSLETVQISLGMLRISSHPWTERNRVRFDLFNDRNNETIAAKYGWWSIWETGSTKGCDQALQRRWVPIRLALGIGGKAKRGVADDDFICNALRLVMVSRKVVIAAEN